MGFHQKEIKKGIYGELSKIQEELDEAYDAEAQGQDLMLLIELSDMIGAIEGVAKKYGFTIEQLQRFATLRSKVAIEELGIESKIEPTPTHSLDALIRRIWFTGSITSDMWDYWELIPGRYNSQLDHLIATNLKINSENDYEFFKARLKSELPDLIKLKG